MKDKLNSREVEELNILIGRVPTEGVVKWAVGRFCEKIVMTSSFQTQSLPLLHMVAKYTPQLPVVFLDTGFHFEETKSYVDLLKNTRGLNLEVMSPLLGIDGFRKKYKLLYEKDPSMCCYLNKVEPLQRALEMRSAWITGVRADQTEIRKNLDYINLQKDGTLKICPMLHWSASDVDNYIEKYKLPRHPLFQKGYISIGCEPCTKKVRISDDIRAGRWHGTEKTECGLHLDQ